MLLDEELLALASQKGNHDEKARAFSRQYAFAWLLQQVGSFWDQLQAGQVRSIGALYNRIERGWHPDPWSDAFRSGSLYQRHYPLSRQEAESRVRRQAYEPDAEPDPVLELLPLPLWDECESAP